MISPSSTSTSSLSSIVREMSISRGLQSLLLELNSGSSSAHGPTSSFAIHQERMHLYILTPQWSKQHSQTLVIKSAKSSPQW